MASIAIAETDNAIVSALSGVLREAGMESVHTASINAALDVAGESGLDVLIIGPSCVGEAALDATEALRTLTGGAVILAPASLDTELMRRALRAGVHDVVLADSAPSEIVESVSAALKAVEEARVQEPSAPEVEEPQVERPLARVVTIFSTKGGVGKTVIATNLAVGLAKSGKNVVLLDLDLQFGDVGIMLGLEPEHTVYEAVQNYERLDAAMIQGLLVPHSSGLRALLAPTHPEDAEAVTATRVTGLIGLLRQVADYIVIDTSPAFNDVTLAALDETDIAYVVTMMDIASIKNTRISIQKLQQLGYRRGVLRLVLNRADSKVFLSINDVEEAVGAKVISRIPSDLVVPRSVNRGVPVLLDAPRSKVAKSLLELTEDATNKIERGDGNVT